MAEPPSDSSETLASFKSTKGLEKLSGSSAKATRLKQEPAEKHDLRWFIVLIVLISVLCLLTVSAFVCLIAWLRDAAPAERIERMWQILMVLVPVLITSAATLMRYILGRRR